MQREISLGLTILLKGMLGIFTISLVLIIFIILLNYLTIGNKINN